MGDVAAWPHVAAVVVTYFPDLDRLRTVLQALAGQVDGVFVVDNSGDGRTTEGIAAVCAGIAATLLPQATNCGLAAGFNTGLRSARQAGFTHGLLMDQDSLPQEGMARRLVETWVRESGQGGIAAIGPRFFDRRGAVPASFSRAGFPVNRPAPARERGGSVFECDYLISSGCLIALAALDRVGELREDLFIDNIDMEWCFRARAMGLRLLGEGAAVLEHELGDARARLPFGRIAIVHGPRRLYYIMRNRVLLYWMPHVPWQWKAQDLLRLPVKLLIFSLLIGPRLDNARHMLLGIWHGLVRRAGPLPAARSASGGGRAAPVRPGSSAS